MKINKKIEKMLLVCLMILIFVNIKISYAKEGISLNKGDYIKFGSYYGEKILWRVIKDDDVNKRVMLISDRILTIKAFDASGENEGRGNNKWNESNIRDWLNSEKTKLTTDDWTHGEPIHSWNNKNNYEDEAGFLSNFLSKERNIIVKMNDNGEKNESGNKVTLLTKDELSLLTEAGYNDYRIKPTKEAVEKSEYKPSSLSADEYCYYWTRTPYESNEYCVYDVATNGSVPYYAAYYADSGIRPVLWIDISGIILNDDVSGDTESQAYTVISFVPDIQKPKIINNESEKNILKDSIYGEEAIKCGVIAIDDVYGNITSSIKISGDTVDTSKIGNYTIRYNVKDGSGNNAEEVTRVIHVLNEIPTYDGYQVGSGLNVGDYINFGSYNDEKILWRVINDDDVNKRVMLISNKILTIKAFDASGENEGRGNNKWNESNIRDWLNSEKTKLTTDDWTHGEPIHSWNNKNNYEDEAGFLSNFLYKERNIIVKMNDNGEKNESGNKVTLLTKDELLLLTEAGYNDYRIKPTKEAVEKSEYKPSSLSADEYCYYWTRTSYESNEYCVYDVATNGSVPYYAAYYADSGIRPVLWIDISDMILDDVNGDSELQAYSVISYDSDTQKPIISNSIAEENILKDSEYGNEQIRIGVIATDDTDGDITSSIEISGDTVDTSKIGDYTIRYNVKDNAKNEANEVIRVVHVLNKIPIYEGYEVGTSPEDRKYFKYYIGLDKRGVIKCMMVCADGGNNTLKKSFSKKDIINSNTFVFRNCYFIDKKGKIKKYNAN